jgi:hypothetical protein
MTRTTNYDYILHSITITMFKIVKVWYYSWLVASTFYFKRIVVINFSFFCCLLLCNSICLFHNSCVLLQRWVNNFLHVLFMYWLISVHWFTHFPWIVLIVIVNVFFIWLSVINISSPWIVLKLSLFSLFNNLHFGWLESLLFFLFRLFKECWISASQLWETFCFIPTFWHFFILTMPPTSPLLTHFIFVTIFVSFPSEGFLSLNKMY